ncbi:prephenate dehydrogenase [Rhizobium sp. NLR22b]|uniref:prephenate dehydrogenase n=1 Tax=Rhizobium sp. NLR22b TaxID=2731115 RepID=UPI001C83D900|nr:prephenate dehydrogenase [Rhizobium sp. NLR22b]MBX5242861.1 prephenate dehydrogenase [Rhizobium sp. NLR22b]
MAKSLGLIGCGAFGSFMLHHIAPFFQVRIYDRFRDLGPIGQSYKVEVGTLAQVAAAEIVVLAVPVQELGALTLEIAPYLRPGTLVLDVASVKLKPTEILAGNLPTSIDIVSTHPLFGPQSGKQGIAGLNVVICPIRGERAGCVARFLKEMLQLKIIETTPERHDREIAYVQGLTHLIAKILVDIELTDIQQTTRTYDLLMQSVEMVRYDSEELFQAIESINPFVSEAKKRFFDSARRLESRLSRHAAAAPAMEARV